MDRLTLKAAHASGGSSVLPNLGTAVPDLGGTDGSNHPDPAEGHHEAQDRILFGPLQLWSPHRTEHQPHLHALTAAGDQSL